MPRAPASQSQPEHGLTEEDIDKIVSDAVFYFLVADQKKSVIKVNRINVLTIPTPCSLYTLEIRVIQTLRPQWEGQNGTGGRALEGKEPARQDIRHQRHRARGEEGILLPGQRADGERRGRGKSPHFLERPGDDDDKDDDNDNNNDYDNDNDDGNDDGND